MAYKVRKVAVKASPSRGSGKKKQIGNPKSWKSKSAGSPKRMKSTACKRK